MSSRLQQVQRVLRLVLLVMLSGVVSACGGGGDAPASGTEGQAEVRANDIVVADVGFATPESVLHDPDADVAPRLFVDDVR